VYDHSHMGNFKYYCKGTLEPILVLIQLKKL
jgi:hypothetical protein